MNAQEATSDAGEVLVQLATRIASGGERLVAGDLVILGCMVAVIDPAPNDEVELRLSTGSSCRCRFASSS